MGILLFSMLTFAVATALSNPADAADITMRVGHGYSAGQPQDDGIRLFAKRVDELTKGKVALQLFGDNSLGNDVQLIEGVLLGTIDATVVANAPLSNFVPEMRILDMPFLFRDEAHLERAVSGPLEAELAKAATAKGLRLLGIYSSGSRHIMSKQPINNIADLKGKKIRTMQNPVHLETFRSFGANATALAYGELYGALQTGVVDGAEAANNNYAAAKFYEVAGNWAMVGWTYLTASILVSEKKFVAFPAEVREALAAAGKESAVQERQLLVKSEEPLVEGLRKSGVRITTPDPGPFREAARPVYDKFLVSEGEKRLLKLVLDAQ
jgi:tripartite ATP-independent transporter DctP family solute receptor